MTYRVSLVPADSTRQLNGLVNGAGFGGSDVDKAVLATGGQHLHPLLCVAHVQGGLKVSRGVIAYHKRSWALQEVEKGEVVKFSTTWSLPCSCPASPRTPLSRSLAVPKAASMLLHSRTITNLGTVGHYFNSLKIMQDCRKLPYLRQSGFVDPRPSWLISLITVWLQFRVMYKLCFSNNSLVFLARQEAYSWPKASKLTLEMNFIAINPPPPPTHTPRGEGKISLFSFKAKPYFEP